jgi:hypothetical protein
MKKEEQGISRRSFVKASAAAAVAGLIPGNIQAQGKDTPGSAMKTGTRLILLGNGGGPRPNKLRAQSSWVVLVNEIPYVVDCGNGTSRQMAFADIPLKSLSTIFITHHHSDHNLEYGSLMYNAWATGFRGRIDTYGPPGMNKMTDLFLELNAYDINIRIPDEGRPPLKPMIFPHEINQGGPVPVIIVPERGGGPGAKKMGSMEFMNRSCLLLPPSAHSPYPQIRWILLGLCLPPAAAADPFLNKSGELKIFTP